MTYSITLDPMAIVDLQKAIDYYDEQQFGLGKRFEKTIDKHFTTLGKNPFFQLRYDNVHCMPVKKFPFMIHYTIDEENKKIKINAVLHTSLNPNKHWKAH